MTDVPGSPQFLSARQLATLAAAVDVVIPRAERALSAAQIAARADAFLAQANAPAAMDIAQGLDLLEYVLPLVILQPPPFTALSYAARTRLIRRIVADKGRLRDLARALKLLATFSYYTDENVRRSIGYVDFEQRPRFPDLDTTLHIHPPPGTVR